jgi:hypothetical protein
VAAEEVNARAEARRQQRLAKNRERKRAQRARGIGRERDTERQRERRAGRPPMTAEETQEANRRAQAERKARNDVERAAAREHEETLEPGRHAYKLPMAPHGEVPESEQASTDPAERERLRAEQRAQTEATRRALIEQNRTEVLALRHQAHREWRKIERARLFGGTVTGDGET